MPPLVIDGPDITVLLSLQSAVARRCTESRNEKLTEQALDVLRQLHVNVADERNGLFAVVGDAARGQRFDGPSFKPRPDAASRRVGAHRDIFCPASSQARKNSLQSSLERRVVDGEAVNRALHVHARLESMHRGDVRTPFQRKAREAAA